ncbi:hypothetical protein H4W00_001511 [Psychrobacter sp. PL19]|uniref:DUF2877 domain-containing protein n=2 Tax=unclassified Psychrobacter TaxID=196806 RepID=UPI001AE6D0C3
MSFNGKVHSVFRRSMNVTTDLVETPWVSLLDSTLPATPTAYQCYFESLGDLITRVKVGDEVFMRGGIIRIKSSIMLAVNTLTAREWQQAPPVSVLDWEKVKNNLIITEKILSEHLSKKEQVEISSVDNYIAYLGLTLPNCIEHSSKELVKNIGFGKGLTPSGDDFLIGAMAVLSSLMGINPKAKIIYQNMQSAIRLNMDKTNDISAHYLGLALSRHFSYPVQWLVYYLLTQEEVSVINTAVVTNLSIGASSGADTIAGMLYFLNELYGLN